MKELLLTTAPGFPGSPDTPCSPCSPFSPGAPVGPFAPGAPGDPYNNKRRTFVTSFAYSFELMADANTYYMYSVFSFQERHINTLNCR